MFRKLWRRIMCRCPECGGKLSTIDEYGNAGSKWVANFPGIYVWGCTVCGLFWYR